MQTDSLRLALVQMNPTVGALTANAARIEAAAWQAAAAGAQVILFPELALCGYPPEDLVLKRHFLRACAAACADLVLRLPVEPVILLGLPEVAPTGGAVNALAVLHGGRQAGTYHKMALPNYGVFDEVRVFAPGRDPLLLDIGPHRLALQICEDTWDLDRAGGVLLAAAQPNALLNASASPYYRGKRGLRQATFAAAARRLEAWVACCNLVGGQDELVFDGASLWLDATGAGVARAPQFEETILYVDLPPPATPPPPPPAGARVLRLFPVAAPASPLTPRAVPESAELEEIHGALTLGLRDYTRKNGFERVLVALSGGIDSALVASLAVDALGADQVLGLTMPSGFTSAETLGDAGQLARNLGIHLDHLPIGGLFEQYNRLLQPLWPDRPWDLTEENLQARIRATLVMALSNKLAALVLTTGNKSESATGYCTIYGDMAGGFAPIKDVPKTLVFALSRWRNARTPRPWIPATTITRPPTAELRPNQLDSDSLPPYEILDGILERYIEQDMGVQQIIEAGFEQETVQRVVRLVDQSEYKRRQSAPGIKITAKAFGRDRRLPITNGFWRAAPHSGTKSAVTR